MLSALEIQVTVTQRQLTMGLCLDKWPLRCYCRLGVVTGKPEFLLSGMYHTREFRQMFCFLGRFPSLGAIWRSGPFLGSNRCGSDPGYTKFEGYAMMLETTTAVRLRGGEEEPLKNQPFIIHFPGNSVGVVHSRQGVDQNTQYSAAVGGEDSHFAPF